MTRTTKDHARCVRLFESDLDIIHRGDADQLAAIYQADKMNTEARLVLDALLAMAED